MIKNVTVMGGGVLGTQIAFQAAYSGFNVTIWLRSEGSIERTKPKLEMVKNSYIDSIKLMDTNEGKSYENWCFGIADYEDFDGELKDKEGIIELEENKEFKCTYKIIIEE